MDDEACIYLYDDGTWYYEDEMTTLGILQEDYTVVWPDEELYEKLVESGSPYLE